MNFQVQIFVLFITAFISTCENQYEHLEEMDKFTKIDLLSEDQSKEIDQVIFNYIHAYSYISVGLLGQDGAVLIRSYGSDRIGVTDVYASVSKPVTSMIFFQMLELGMIASVDDSIAMYSEKYQGVMPDEFIDSPVTFKHLLAHQSGLPHHDLIWENGKLVLEFEPGTSTLYSTNAYGVLGEILSEISDMSYNHLLKSYIGNPVQAESFTASSFLFEAPGGLVNSTISDMALFANGVLDNVYISDSLKMNLQWVPVTSDPIGAIGMGWYLTNYGTDSLAVFHAGSNGKPRAFIALRPKQHLGVVLMGKNHSSHGSQRFYELARDLTRKLREFESSNNPK
jgi:CubicO group peptidase (beta-lactamase class C family)